uniref:Uncharacterized protein n=1 Tax=Trichogramma kaykai TaxID=54128 RepID=A0ABD2WCZ4_9HYME
MIASNVNSTLKDTLASTEIDGYLFGKDLSERLKQTKLTSLDVQALAKKSSSSAPKNSKRPARAVETEEHLCSCSEMGTNNQQLTARRSRRGTQRNLTGAARAKTAARRTIRGDARCHRRSLAIFLSKLGGTNL